LKHLLVLEEQTRWHLRNIADNLIFRRTTLAVLRVLGISLAGILLQPGISLADDFTGL
jgi:hypothetical protein